MDSGEQATSVVVGTVLIGIWLGWALFQDGEWMPWGFFGFVLAGALFAARLSGDWVRILLWAVCGLGFGLLVVFALVQASAAVLATMFTFGGSALALNALPTRSKGEPKDT